jgi:hypothetical protein
MQRHQRVSHRLAARAGHGVDMVEPVGLIGWRAVPALQLIDRYPIRLHLDGTDRETQALAEIGGEAGLGIEPILHDVIEARPVAPDLLADAGSGAGPPAGDAIGDGRQGRRTRPMRPDIVAEPARRERLSGRRHRPGRRGAECIGIRRPGLEQRVIVAGAGTVLDDCSKELPGDMVGLVDAGIGVGGTRRRGAHQSETGGKDGNGHKTGPRKRGQAVEHS